MHKNTNKQYHSISNRINHMEQILSHRVHLVFELYGRHPDETPEFGNIADHDEKKRNEFLGSLSFNNEKNKSLTVLNVSEGGLRCDVTGREVRFCGNYPDTGMRFKGEWDIIDQLDIMETFRDRMNTLLHLKYDADCRGRLFIE